MSLTFPTSSLLNMIHSPFRASPYPGLFQGPGWISQDYKSTLEIVWHPLSHNAGGSIMISSCVMAELMSANWHQETTSNGVLGLRLADSLTQMNWFREQHVCSCSHCVDANDNGCARWLNHIEENLLKVSFSVFTDCFPSKCHDVWFIIKY